MLLYKVASKATALKCSMLEALDHPEWLEKELKPKPRKGLFAFARMMDSFRELPSYPVAEVLRTILNATGLPWLLSKVQRNTVRSESP